MAEALAKFRPYLSRVRPWIAVVVLLGVVLMGYYSILGMRYLGSSDDVASLNNEIRQLATRLGRTLPDEELLRAEQESQEQRLEAVRRIFSNPGSDQLVAILSATAQEAGVELQRISVAEGRGEIQGTVRYWFLPMDITLQGEALDIYRFLSLLQQKVPTTQVAGIGMSNLGASPSAQVDLLFHLSPGAAAQQ